MKIYISGGIAGLDRNKRRAEFARAAEGLRSLGHETVNAFDCVPEAHEEPCPRGYAVGEEHSSACHLKADLLALLSCDAIWLLDGWELSRGARLEHSVAADCGLQIYYPGQVSLPNKLDHEVYDEWTHTTWSKK